MRTTVSLTKTPMPQVKNLTQKVMKLTGTGAGKSKLQAAPLLRADKAERSTRSATKLVAVKTKNKASAKTDGKTADKAKKAPARSKSAAATASERRDGASYTTASKLKKSEKSTAVQHAVPTQESIKSVANKEIKALNHSQRLTEMPGNAGQSWAGGSPLSRLSLDDIKIFQIYYLPEQESSLDPDFAPYDNSGNSSRLFEFSVFTKLAQSEQIKKAPLWGAMSWKFGRKAGISGRQLKEEIIAHPGYDAYYSNPFPENEALFHNMWLQGEIAHPNFLPLCTEIFEVAGLPPELLNSVQPSSEFAAANYFVANQIFWKAYIGFVSRVLITADKKLSPTAKRILYSSTADKFGAHAEASYIPFLVERLFTVFLRTDGAKFKTFKLKLEEREKKDNVHLKLLSEMKDVACRTKSTWLAACWINYRNLYLSKTFGENWTKKNLKQITPPNIVFMPGSV